MEFKSNTKYYCHHKPTKEDWVVLGINFQTGKVCAAGFPPSIGAILHCENFEEAGPLTEEDLKYRNAQFGPNWI